MQGAGIRPNVRTYTALVGALGRGGQWPRAQALLRCASRPQLLQRIQLPTPGRRASLCAQSAFAHMFEGVNLLFGVQGHAAGAALGRRRHRAQRLHILSAAQGHGRAGQRSRLLSRLMRRAQAALAAQPPWPVSARLLHEGLARPHLPPFHRRASGSWPSPCSRSWRRRRWAGSRRPAAPLLHSRAGSRPRSWRRRRAATCGRRRSSAAPSPPAWALIPVAAAGAAAALGPQRAAQWRSLAPPTSTRWSPTACCPPRWRSRCNVASAPGPTRIPPCASLGYCIEWAR